LESEAEAMKQASGAMLSHYRLTEKIGEGGMGVVWRATDTTLDREVAVKILPEIFSEDPERLARFDREAKLLASLNHPSIAVIHGLHHAEGVHFLAMELVQGEDLAQRLQRGALPVEEAVGAAKQVAEALEAAHESGVIHRDLKPANIQITPDGKIKVLDFGLAKAFDTESTSGSPSMSPTMTSAGTRAGMILGTAAYMSPEQARGKPVDRRADIWAFGCVLYEMLTGKQAFGGETISDSLASVLKSEPDWKAVPKEVPGPLNRLLRACLQKDPKRRLQAIGDARVVLEELQSGQALETEPAAVAIAPQERPPVLRLLPWLLLALALVATPFMARIFSPAVPTAQKDSTRLNVDLSSPNGLMGELGSSVVLSPDGRTLAYVAEHGNVRQLFVRRLDQLEGTPLAGTEDAYSPFFSPDGEWIGFFAANKLRKVQVSGGSPLTLGEIGSGEQARGGTWGRGGSIVFTPQYESGLFRVSDTGGKAEPLTKLDSARKERSHRWPVFLPDGKHVLFAVQLAGQRYDQGEIDVVSLESGERKNLYQGGAFPRYAASGHLLFVRNEALFAIPFDAGKLEISGSPRSVVDSLATLAGDQEAGDGSAQFDVSESGSLAYRSGALGQSALSMVWVDRSGVASPVTPEKLGYNHAAVSPDGKRIAVSISGAGGTDIWIYEIERGVLTRFTFNGAGNSMPVWTPDGQWIAFTSLGDKGVPNLFRKRADGAGDMEHLVESPLAQYAQSWTPDGKILAFFERDPDSSWDLAVHQPGAKAPNTTFLKTPAIEGFPNFSPDGRWLAYMSDESGRFEVYVRPFPGPGGKWQISSQGGVYPRWSRAGGELFYRNGNALLAVTNKAEGESFRAEKPRELFRGSFAQYGFTAGYDTTPDGKRFVMFLPEGDEASMARTHVILVFNWLDELRGEFGPGGVDR
jgi:serine/threonine-protein kinase